VLDGDPELGKSTLLLDVAARVTTHGLMPADVQGVTGGVVILSAEDGVEDVILPRLCAAADLNRVECVEEVGGDPPVFPKHLEAVEEVIRRLDARLLLIDPLTAYLAVDTPSDQEVQRALHPVKKIAEHRRCAVVYLRYLNKGTGTKAIYRDGGSIAISASARSGMLVAPDPDAPTHRVLAHVKHYYAANAASALPNARAVGPINIDMWISGGQLTDAATARQRTGG
jgi:RecA-family ATPase